MKTRNQGCLAKLKTNSLLQLSTCLRWYTGSPRRATPLISEFYTATSVRSAHRQHQWNMQPSHPTRSFIFAVTSWPIPFNVSRTSVVPSEVSDRIMKTSQRAERLTEDIVASSRHGGRVGVDDESPLTRVP